MLGASADKPIVIEDGDDIIQLQEARQGELGQSDHRSDDLTAQALRPRSPSPEMSAAFAKIGKPIHSSNVAI